MEGAKQLSRPIGDIHGAAFGYGCGMIMAFGASISFAAARAGVLAGLSADDMIFGRFVVAGVAMLPLLVYWGLPSLAGIGWPRGLALLLTGGPLFAILQTAGYAFAPLAHAGVIAPSTVTILSTFAAGFVLGEALTRSHLAGAGLVLAGIGLIGWQGIFDSAPGERAWIGDVLFLLSSMLWAGFTLLIRVWRIDAVRATAVVAVLSLCVVVPIYLGVRGPAHLAALPRTSFVFQALLQGLLQSVITIMAFSRAVAILGVSRAVLFPALVPAISVLIGIPALGEIPTALQLAGVVVVSAGMLVAVGASTPLFLSLLPRSGGSSNSLPLIPPPAKRWGGWLAEGQSGGGLPSKSSSERSSKPMEVSTDWLWGRKRIRFVTQAPTPASGRPSPRFAGEG